MYSVIIPTLWKANLDDFKETLAVINSNDDVKEIIVIDNDPTFDIETKQNVFSNITKLHHLRMNENVYVNPAWNIGASKASQEFLVFLNDDVWCNPSINTVFNAHKLHEDKDGLFGLSTSCFQNKNPREVNEFEDIIIVDNEGRGTGWGCFFFIKREQWVPIPDELKIWCGDDFITHNAISKQRKIYSIKNVYVTPWSTTERAPEFSEIKQNDIKIFFNTN